MPRGVRVGPGDRRRARARRCARGDGVDAAVDGRRTSSTRITAQTVYEAAKQGDARRATRSCATPRAISAPASRTCSTSSIPDVVVIAGGVTRGGRRAVRAAARRSAAPRVQAGGRGVRIVPGTLPGTAGVVGAVATFKQQHWAACERGFGRRHRRGSAPVPPRKKRLGVIGTFVWDVIHGRDPRSAPGRGVGRHHVRAERARRGARRRLGDRAAHEGRRAISRRARASSFARCERIAPDAALIDVPYPEQPRRAALLRATSAARERLTGGVPGVELARPQAAARRSDLDALYVNFLSGWELDLETTQLLRQHFRGPIYCDLHLLVLGGAAGRAAHAAAAPERRASGARCFDLLQVNEDELAMMAPDPMALAATAIASGVSCARRHARQARRGVLRRAGLRRARATSARATVRSAPAHGTACRTALVPAEPVDDSATAIRPDAATCGARPISPDCSPVIT